MKARWAPLPSTRCAFDGVAQPSEAAAGCFAGKRKRLRLEAVNPSGTGIAWDIKAPVRPKRDAAADGVGRVTPPGASCPASCFLCHPDPAR